MKQLSIFIFLFVSIATGCTEFEEPMQGATYRWEINGILVDAKANSSELRVNENGVPQLPEVFAPIGDPVLFANATFISARCRATLNGSTTKWSAASTVTIFGSTF